jgi:hypothetical protein
VSVILITKINPGKVFTSKDNADMDSETGILHP